MMKVSSSDDVPCSSTSATNLVLDPKPFADPYILSLILNPPRDPIEKRYREVGLPWPAKTLIDSVRVASLKYGLAHTAATRKVSSLPP
jgi:hypothetical protein